MSGEAEAYGPEFTLAYSTLIGDVWGSDAEEAKLQQDPTKYAKEKGLPVEAGAVVRLDRSQPDGLLKRSELVRGWSETPGTHILFVPEHALIDPSELTEGELDLIGAGDNNNNVCFFVLA